MIEGSGTPVRVPKNEHYMQADLTFGNSSGSSRKGGFKSGGEFKKKNKDILLVEIGSCDQIGGLSLVRSGEKKIINGYPCKIISSFSGTPVGVPENEHSTQAVLAFGNSHPQYRELK